MIEMKQKDKQQQKVREAKETVRKDRSQKVTKMTILS
jgi:hypothetical protein